MSKKSVKASPTKSDVTPAVEEVKLGKGQPTKYKPEVCDTIKEWGHQGYSQEEMCAALKIHPDTFHEWEKVHPEFSEASIVAMNNSMAWWERVSRNGVVYQTAFGTRVDAGLFARSMSARFPKKYREQQSQVQVNATGNNSAVEVNFASSDKPDD